MTLSICIPTFNRAEYLPATLDSIAAQWTDGLEITVADNASTDDTQRIVDRYRDRLGDIKYFRWESNQGADRNYLKSVEIATGDYCWILGSDDPIAPGAIATLIATITERSPTIILFNRMLCTRELTPVREDRYLTVGDVATAWYDFSQRGELERYLENASSMCAAFSYLSSMAFARDAWNAVTDHEAFIGSDTLLRAPVKVGKNAATGAGAVVTKDVPDDHIAIGMPARMRTRKKPEPKP